MQTTKLTNASGYSAYHSHALHRTAPFLPSSNFHHRIHSDLIHALPDTSVPVSNGATVSLVTATAGYPHQASMEANTTTTLLNSATILAVHAAAAPPQPTQISVLTTAVPALVNSQCESIFVPQGSFSGPTLLATTGDNPLAAAAVMRVPAERHPQSVVEDVACHRKNMQDTSHFANLSEEVQMGTHLSESAPSEEPPVCRDYLRNACRRGKRCRFQHPPHNQLEQTTLQQRYGSGLAHIEALVCHDYQNQGCYRFNCRFLHLTTAEEEHFRVTGELPMHAKQQMAESGVPISAVDGEPPLCKNYLNGQCHRGSRCKYRHTISSGASVCSVASSSVVSSSMHSGTLEAPLSNPESLQPQSAGPAFSQLVFSNALYNPSLPPTQHVLGSSVTGTTATSGAPSSTTATLLVPASMATLQPISASSIAKAAASHHTVITPTQVAIIPTVSVTTVQDAPNIVTITNATHSLPCSAVHMNASGDLLTVVPALSLTAAPGQGSTTHFHHHHHHQNPATVVVSGISAASAQACCHTSYPVYVATSSSGERPESRRLHGPATEDSFSSRCSSSNTPPSPSHHTLCDSEEEGTSELVQTAEQHLRSAHANMLPSCSTSSRLELPSDGVNASRLETPCQVSLSSRAVVSMSSGTGDTTGEDSLISPPMLSASSLHRSHRKKLRLQLFSESDSGTCTPSPSWDTLSGAHESETSTMVSLQVSSTSSIAQSSSSSTAKPTRMSSSSSSSVRKLHKLPALSKSTLTTSTSNMERGTSASSRRRTRPLSKSESKQRVSAVHHRQQVYMLRQMDELHRENRELRRALDDIRTANNDLRAANQVLLEQNVRLRSNNATANAVPVTAVAMAAPHFLPANALTAASVCSLLPTMTVLSTSTSQLQAQTSRSATLSSTGSSSRLSWPPPSQ